MHTSTTYTRISQRSSSMMGTKLALTSFLSDTKMTSQVSLLYFVRAANIIQSRPHANVSLHVMPMLKANPPARWQLISLWQRYCYEKEWHTNYICAPSDQIPIYFSLETIKRPELLSTPTCFIILSLCVPARIYICIINIAGGLIKVSMQHGCAQSGRAGWPSTQHTPICWCTTAFSDFDSSRTTPKCQTAFQYDQNPQRFIIYADPSIITAQIPYKRTTWWV